MFKKFIKIIALHEGFVMKKFICAFILSMLPVISASALEIKMNEKIGDVVSGTVLTGSQTKYKPVLLRIENESGDTVYINQIYTDINGQAYFKFIHNQNKSGYGKMTIYAVSAEESGSVDYFVEEGSADQYVSVECVDITTSGNMSSMQYKITNTGIVSRGIYAAAAVYKDGRLEYIVSDKIILKGGQTVTDNINVPFASGSDIKTFMWDIDTMTAYCDPIVWEKVVPETIRVEAENAVTYDFTPQYLSGDGVSGTLVHLYKSTFNPDTDYTLTYEVDCAISGVYDVSAVISNSYKGGYTADCFVSVNSEEPVHSSEAVLVEDVTVGVNGLAEDQLDKYSFGQVFLAKGTNKLTLNIEGKNWMNNSAVFQADYFEFTPVEKTATEAALKAHNAALNIFEKQDGVNFDLLLNGIAEQDSSVEYTITDYFGEVCDSGKIVIEMGSYKGRISSQVLETGWYELEVNGALINNSVTFAVVPNSSERNLTAYNPFAVDLATSHLVGSHYEQRQYAKAARLSGADWVRDRFNWSELEAKEGTYNYNYIKGDTDTLKDEELSVTNTFSAAPVWARNSGETLPKNPQIMYNLIYNAATGLDGFVDVWEIWNEQDAYQFSKEGADKYAALFKAAAIAADNAGIDQMIALGGLCTSIDNSSYNHLLFQNGVMDYLDIYNYHTHLTYEAQEDTLPVPMKDRMRMYKLLADLYGIGDKTIWQTESGIRQKISDNSGLTALQEKAQAQHIVPAYLEAVAAGIDKYFMFIGVPYIEGGADFGVFDANNEPRPAYAAWAVMTKLLEGTSYLGEVHSLPDGAKGYALEDDSRVIEVLWSSEMINYTVPSNATVYDLMGNLILSDSVTLWANPVYMIYQKEDAPNNIYKRAASFTKATKTTFTDTQKIVLSAQYPVTNIETDKENGYSMSYSKDNTVTVTIYNFSDKEMSGTLSATGENGNAFDIVCPTDTLTVLPNSTATVDIVLKRNANTVFGASYDFAIGGIFNGEEISPYAAWVCFDRDISNFTTLNGSNKITGDGWQAPAKTDNINASVSLVSNGVQFDIASDGDGGYYYPFVYSRSQDLAGYDGITLSVWFDKTVAKDLNNYLTIQVSNGSATFTLAESDNVAVKKGWNNYSFKWSDFSKKINGSADSISNILGKYMYVRIGVQTTQTALTYKLADVGLFTSDEKEALPEISVNAQRDGSGAVISAILPDNVSDARVLYDGKYVAYQINDNEISLTVDNVDDGKHTVVVSAYTLTGRAIYKQIEF